MTDNAQRAKAELFQRLHKGPEVLVLANCWDVASARLVEAAGCPAVATSSAGVAWALGYADGENISRDLMAEMVGRVCAAVRVPVTADMEAGYGKAPEAAAETMRAALEAGAVGINLEDSDAASGHKLIDFGLAVERVGAARAAADAAGIPAVINARTDAFFPSAMAGGDRFAEAVERANAYLAAGAASVFVPFLADAAVIGRLAREIDGPLNILARPGSPSIGEMKALGVARVSVGGVLATSAYAVVKRAAAELMGPGTYTFAEGAIPHPEMNKLMGG
ncbi:MAG: isocitrate lyase/PEP mutase family protein [Candidatus Eiseniibacteriota bacterium]